MSGEEEHDRYVSHYEVRVYRDSVLVFTGIIDTSQTTWDLAEQIITFSAYSKDKLFTTFSDLESWLALAAGYTPGSLLGVFATVLATKAPIRLNFITTAWTAPSFTIPYYEPLNIAQIDYADMRELPAASDGWSYALVDPWGPHFGYACFSPGYIPFFYFANIVTIKATKSGYADKYILRFRARCCRFYNGIAPVVDSYDHATAPLANTSGDEASQARNEFDAWIVRHGTTLSLPLGITRTSPYPWMAAVSISPNTTIPQTIMSAPNITVQSSPLKSTPASPTKTTPAIPPPSSARFRPCSCSIIPPSIPLPMVP